MSPSVVLFIIAFYFLVLIAISLIIGKSTDNKTFFQANKNSKWYVVAFGMIGASLSGVTFISVPGWVGSSSFSYMQVVFGYLLGYYVIIYFLLPLYYKLNLISIYTYLEKRFGFWSYKTGAFFFLVSRVIGASFRLFLVAIVFNQYFEIPFWISAIITIVLIWVYTFRSGIKTIVWTDTLQTFFMITAVIATIILIKNELNWSFLDLFTVVKNSNYSQIFFFDDWRDTKFFPKQFFAGTFIAIVMTGLDQDMMQKNLTCRNIKDAQKNMWGLSISLVFVNVIFLTLGALLFIYSAQKGIPTPERADSLFANLALNHLPISVGVFFILGLVAAAYSSADSALTSLTTSFCVDFLGFSEVNEGSIKTRTFIHLGFSLLLFLVILTFHLINNESVIETLFKAAGYTYGPLLGMFSFGIFTKRIVIDKILVPLICFFSPLVCFLLNYYSTDLFYGYKFGFELLILNGLITFIGFWLISSAKVTLN